MDQKRLVRFIWFGLSILAGILAGLFLGWSLLSGGKGNSGPESLRQDYKIDYILMVSEIYHQDRDFTAATARIALLGEDVNLRYIQQTILTARDMGYNTNDLELMVELSQAILAATPEPIGGSQ